MVYQGNLLSKTLVIGILILFIGFSNSFPVESLSLNNHPPTENQLEIYDFGNENRLKTPFIPMIRPPENSVICGYVTDEFSNEPIEGASIYLYWENEHINLTFTDDTGFYHMNIPKGEIHIRVGAAGYRRDSFYCGIVGENETKWKNISLIPLPPKVSIVCGYVIDGITQEPMKKNVFCEFSYAYYGVLISMNTMVDNNGFYKFNVPATEDYWFLYIYTNDYFDYHGGGGIIEENETIWKNVSLYPYPYENSVVCGYVKEFYNGTSIPIENVSILICWHSEYGSLDNTTLSNENGFFKMNVAAGELELFFGKKGYREHQALYTIEEYETLWFNISMQRSRAIVKSLLSRFLERFPLLEVFLRAMNLLR
jgi:hypothetical protein